MANPEHTPDGPERPEPPKASWTRRALLLSGLGAGVAAATNLAGAPSASATSGPMLYGETNFADENSTSLGSSNPNSTLFVANNSAIGGDSQRPYTILAFASIGTGVLATAGQGIGVQAHANSGTGLLARSSSGPALRLETGWRSRPPRHVGGRVAGGHYRR